MRLTIVFIAFISVCSVLMDSNLKEFCSKSYFHSFVTYYSKGRQALQLNRKLDSSDSSYHSWDLMIEKWVEMYRTTNISYTLKEGQIPNSSLSQPKYCPIRVESSHELSTGFTAYNWTLKDFHFYNHAILGAKVKYTNVVFKSTQDIYDNMVYIGQITEETDSWLIPKDIWLSGMLCRMSGTAFYYFVEKINEINTSNRLQFVTRLKIIGKSVSKKQKVFKFRHFFIKSITRPKIYFSFDSMNKTIPEFLGIDCQNIEKETEFIVPTPTPVFGAVGHYPEYQHLDVNLPECGLMVVPISHEIHFASNCFPKPIENKTVVYFDKIQEELKNHTSNVVPNERIFLGHDTSYVESPWTVLVLFHREDYLVPGTCTGVLITFQWVLTAAHCYLDSDGTLNNIEVRVGTHTGYPIEVGHSNRAHFYQHPNFTDPPKSVPDPEVIKFENDIALIKLNTPFPRNRNDGTHYLINTVCLPTGEVNTNKTIATIFGFGRIDDSGRKPDILQKAKVHLKPFDECRLKTFCASFDYEEQARPCLGDSGGPLITQIRFRSQRNVLIGIEKSGSPLNATCSNRTLNYWTAVPYVIDWILTTIAENY